MILQSILKGILGSLTAVFPISFSANYVFLNKINGTVYGKSGLTFGSDACFPVYLGIFAALLIIYQKSFINLKKGVFCEKNKDNEEKKTLKELLICLAFYIPTVLFNIFFENARINNALLCTFIFLNTAVLFASDYIKKQTIPEKLSVYAQALGALIGGLTGFSEISLIYFARLLSGEKPNRAIRYTLILYAPISLLKSAAYLIKACVAGFTLNIGFMLLIFAFAFVTAFFAASVLKKAAVKRNFRLFAYYTAAFLVIAAYTFIKG